MGKVEKLMKNDFGDENKYIKTKIKIYAGSMITKFS